MRDMRIEVWSDVVCPWCFIGKRRLERALAASPDAEGAEIVHRAFQLDPGAVTMGQRTVDVLSTKYGLDPAGAERMMNQVSEVASSEGLQYRLTETTSGNTSAAHQVLLWAQAQGAGQELLEQVFSGYFEQAQPIFSVDDLSPFILGVGLDPEGAREMVTAGSYLADVKSDQAQARELGATGVPFFVFDGKYGLSGAQPFETFVQTIESAVATG